MFKKIYYIIIIGDDNMKNIKIEILEWIICIVIAITLALLIRYYVGTPTIVKSTSMEPTLIEGQRLILNRIIRTTKEIPNRGDIITFEAPDITKSAIENEKAVYNDKVLGWFEKFKYNVLEIEKVSYIKRIIALPREKVSIKNGKVYINDEELQENYLESNVKTEVKNEKMINFTVPEGYIFAMGDNREHSLDCREFGCIPLNKVESKVYIRIWPLSKFGKVK